MIGKRIRPGVRRARGGILQLLQAVRALSSYIVDASPEQLVALARIPNIANYVVDGLGIERTNLLAEVGVEPGEKVRVFGTINLAGNTLEEWQEEMLAVAARCPRARNPVEHYVLSWQEGECPTDDQAREATEILVETLGAKNCQALWSLHENTRYRHVHVMLVRVDLVSSRTVALGDGWDIDRLHQSLALIEERQGWRSEPEALFVSQNGVVFDRKTGAMVRDDRGNQRQRERRLRGRDPLIEPSVQVAIAASISDARNWADLHRRLAAIGVSYRKSGSGGRIAVAGEEFKCSSLNPDWSRKSLEKLFGQPFEPHKHAGNGIAYEDYRRAASAELDRIRTAHADARARLNQARDHALLAVRGSPHAAALRGAIYAEFGAARTAVDAAFSASKAIFVQGRMTLAEWSAGGQPAAPKHVQLPLSIFPATPTTPERPVTTDPLFEAQTANSRTDFFDRTGTLAFTDYRAVIIVHEIDLTTVDAALMLAAARWDSVRVSGSPRFLALCAQVTADRSLRVVDHLGRSLLPEKKDDPFELEFKQNPNLDTTSLTTTSPLEKQLREMESSSEPRGEVAYQAQLEFLKRNGRSR